ncbi:hypothetical protein Vafri_20918, partial [Volvox africanus]
GRGAAENSHSIRWQMLLRHSVLHNVRRHHHMPDISWPFSIKLLSSPKPQAHVNSPPNASTARLRARLRSQRCAAASAAAASAGAASLAAAHVATAASSLCPSPDSRPPQRDNTAQPYCTATCSGQPSWLCMSLCRTPCPGVVVSHALRGAAAVAPAGLLLASAVRRTSGGHANKYSSSETSSCRHKSPYQRTAPRHAAAPGDRAQDPKKRPSRRALNALDPTHPRDEPHGLPPWQGFQPGWARQAQLAGRALQAAGRAGRT